MFVSSAPARSLAGKSQAFPTKAAEITISLRCHWLFSQSVKVEQKDKKGDVGFQNAPCCTAMVAWALCQGLRSSGCWELGRLDEMCNAGIQHGGAAKPRQACLKRLKMPKKA